MQVVLNQDVKKLGYRGEVVNVKSGYFRNFLLPRGLADFASESRLKLAAVRREKLVMQREQILENVKEVLEKLKGFVLRIKARVSSKGKLYGALTEADIAQTIESELKVKLEKDWIKMDHLKELGEHKIVVHLAPGLESEITVLVEADETDKGADKAGGEPVKKVLKKAPKKRVTKKA